MNCFRRYIDWRGSPQKAAARLGVHWSGLYPILRGERACSPRLAVLIEEESGGKFRAARLIEETVRSQIEKRSRSPARKRRK